MRTIKFTNQPKGNYMSAQMVKVFGEYRNTPIEGVVFPLKKGFTEGKKHNFITVDGTPVAGFPNRFIRVTVADKDAFTFVGKDVPAGTVDSTPVSKETEAEAIERIRERFEILNEMTEATMEGTVRGMIVSGPPGVGKSFGVENTLEKHHTFNKLAGDCVQICIGKNQIDES